MLEEYEELEREQYHNKNFSIDHVKPRKPSGLPPKPPKTLHNFKIDEVDEDYDDEEEEEEDGNEEFYGEEEEYYEDFSEEEEEEKSSPTQQAHTSLNSIDPYVLKQKIEAKSSSLVESMEQNFNFFNSELQKIARKSLSSEKSIGKPHQTLGIPEPNEPIYREDIATEKEHTGANQKTVEVSKNPPSTVKTSPSVSKDFKDLKLVEPDHSSNSIENFPQNTQNTESHIEDHSSPSSSPSSSFSFSPTLSKSFEDNNVSNLSDNSTNWNTADLSESFVLIQKFYGKFLDESVKIGEGNITVKSEEDRKDEEQEDEETIYEDYNSEEELIEEESLSLSQEQETLRVFHSFSPLSPVSSFEKP